MSEKYRVEESEEWSCALDRFAPFFTVVGPCGSFAHNIASRRKAEAVCEALNVHEATGLTPSQLQARVAELEAETLELKRHASEISKQWCATAMHDAKVGEREKKRISDLEGALGTFVSDAVEDDVKGETLVLSSPESLKLARKVLGQ